MKRTIRMSNNSLKRMISESVRRILFETQCSEQWEEEIKMFLYGLENGDGVPLSDDEIGVRYYDYFNDNTAEYDDDEPDNDVRYITYKIGDRKLTDDHFCMQHSRPLTTKEMTDIYYALRQKYGMDMPDPRNKRELYGF